MNARVFLLILVTAFFMAAWNGDEAAMQAAIARRADRQAQAIAAASAPPVEPQTAPVTAAAQPLTTVSVKSGEDVVEVAAASVPLPKGIAPGTYQAVNQAGTSIRLDVDEPSESPARDFYMVDAEDGDRWYLIRVTR